MNVRQWRDVWRRFAGRGAYPYQLAFLLLLPFRRIVLSPNELVERLHLTETSRVLELGPGPGFFSLAVARHLPRGRLYLMDLQREMLNKARRRLQRSGLNNASFVQADAAALPLANDVLDVAFLVAVLGEVSDPRACLASLAPCLRPGGILSITELAGDPDALTESQAEALARAAGLQPIERFPNRGGFTANFRKPCR
jgi:ubiquinone/menaquinone biosynthesis C-methylase UbiE